MHKISVVVPCYNGEKYVAEAIESVLRQTYPVHEIIAVNDGSTDSSRIILEGFPEICVINQENKGISAALNVGIKKACGHFIAFNDSDDIWNTEKIALQIAAMEKNLELEAVFGMVENYVSPELSESEKATILCPSNPLKGFLKGCMLAKREVFQTYGYFDESLRTGDFIEWFSRAKDSGINFGFVEETVLKRRLHTTNLTSSPNLGKDFASILRKRLELQRKKK